VIVIETHFADLPAYREARTLFFAERSGPPPASTTVQVSGLVTEGALLEVGVTAALR
jgi:enamine deaminase RidA (YjgF/YER057c/UK114 family)